MGNPVTDSAISIPALSGRQSVAILNDPTTAKDGTPAPYVVAANPAWSDPVSPATPLRYKGLQTATIVSSGATTVTLSVVNGLVAGRRMVLSSPGITPPVISSAVPGSLTGHLINGTSYGYKVSALSAYGESLPSAEMVCAIPTGVLPPVMTGATTAASGTGTDGHLGQIQRNIPLAYRVAGVNGLGTGLPSQEVTVTTAANLAEPTHPNLSHADVTSWNTQGAGLMPGTAYWFKVTAVNGIGQTMGSTAFSLTTDTNHSSAPLATTVTSGAITANNITPQTVTLASTAGLANGANLSVGSSGGGDLEVVQNITVSGNTVTGIFTLHHNAGIGVTNYTCAVSLFWNDVATATSYNVYAATTQGGAYGKANSVTLTTGNNGAFIANAGTSPGTAIPGSNTTATDTNIATLTWLPSIGATGYRIYGRTQNGEQLIASVSGGATTTYIDSGFTTPSGAVPVVDTSGTITNTVALTWGAVTGATNGYNIYGRVSGQWLLLHSVAAGTTTWTDDGTTAPQSGLLPPAQDSSMLPAEVQTVAPTWTNPGGENVAVALSGTPNSTRTTAAWDLDTGTGPGAAGMLSHDMPAVASVVYDPITKQSYAVRTATADGVSPTGVPLTGGGLLNAQGGMDRQRGVSGVALVTQAAIPSVPVVHRLNVTAVDSSDPATPQATSATLPTGAIIPQAGQNYIDLDVLLAYTAGGAASCTLTPMYWNPRQQVWVPAAPVTVSLSSTTTIYEALRLETRGRTVYIKVTGLTSGASVIIDVIQS